MNDYRLNRQKDNTGETLSSVSRCRVCTKAIHAGEDAVGVPYRGAHYTVCCPSCATKFKASPTDYVGEI